MTDEQAAQSGDAARDAWSQASIKPSKVDVPDRWYAVNTRESPTFRKTVSSLAWGSYAWFASEPDSLMVFSSKPLRIEGN